MIGRLFWLAVGTALGVRGYRKVARLARTLSPASSQRSTQLAGPWRAAAARPEAGAPPAGFARRGHATARFIRDVREGMRIYRLSAHDEAPTLGRQGITREWAASPAFADRECADEGKDSR